MLDFLPLAAKPCTAAARNKSCSAFSTGACTLHVRRDSPLIGAQDDGVVGLHGIADVCCMPAASTDQTCNQTSVGGINLGCLSVYQQQILARQTVLRLSLLMCCHPFLCTKHSGLFARAVPDVFAQFSWSPFAPLSPSCSLRRTRLCCVCTDLSSLQHCTSATHTTLWQMRAATAVLLGLAAEQ